MASVREIIRHLVISVNQTPKEYIRVGRLVDGFNYDAFAMLLAVPAALIVLPTGLIPGMSTLCAVVICFFATQLAMGRDTPWIPQRLASLKVNKDVFKRQLTRSFGVASWLDKIIKPRFSSVFSRPVYRAIGMICMVLSFLIVPLELLPWASTVPALVILLLSLCLLIEDGLVLSVVSGALFCGIFATTLLI